MKTAFISDLHLSEQHPEITTHFQDFLRHLPEDLEALYILGDLFETWIGDDENTPFQKHVASILKTASQYCTIYFMPGNRDFLLGNNFCILSGMNYLKDPTVITLYGIKTLLMHGDSLCTQDKLFQVYRKIVRSSLFKFLFLKISLSNRKKIAIKMRNRSRQRNQRISTELMDVNYDSLKQMMRKYHCTQAIYGHTHRPGVYYFDMQSTIKKVYVLYDWNESENERWGKNILYKKNLSKYEIYFEDK